MAPRRGIRSRIVSEQTPGAILTWTITTLTRTVDASSLDEFCRGAAPHGRTTNRGRVALGGVRPMPTLPGRPSRTDSGPERWGTMKTRRFGGRASGRDHRFCTDRDPPDRRIRASGVEQGHREALARPRRAPATPPDLREPGRETPQSRAAGGQRPDSNGDLDRGRSLRSHCR